MAKADSFLRKGKKAMNLYLEVAKMLGVANKKKFNIRKSDGELCSGAPFWIDSNGLNSTNDSVGIWQNMDSLAKGVYKVAPWKKNTKVKNEDLQLCFVDHKNRIMYFTDDFDEVHGDAWDIAPYEYNAEPPYGEYVKAKIAFTNDEFGDISFTPPYGQDVSVRDINAGATPWITALDCRAWDKSFDECDDDHNFTSAGSLMGGATMAETIIWLRKAGCQWGELHD